MPIKHNKKGSAKSKAFSWSFFPKGKKGIELTMSLVVTIIILLALLVFVLIFLTGQGGRLTGLWENITVGAVQQAGQ